ncbi:Protein roadkill [Tetrabaena socialis]|uniref:Protein roadkill n=1 Tax=Tetrabaena socialis TaxID=47790 RepID=A0A2J7ZV82_9CHLO|nr:Protein roadkill [Tetrabaena socialis]|eukprot:PNH04172.1 Protein roadkill [Tetrabaena socialis]
MGLGKHPSNHISLFLVADEETQLLGPYLSFKLGVKHHKDPNKDCVKEACHIFSTEAPDWGFAQFMLQSEVSVESGYLSSSGTLTVIVQARDVGPHSGRAKKRNRVVPSGLGSDLLALLDEPGDTADLTITAGGRSFRVHRAILAARCTYFKTLFSSTFADSAAKELPLADTNAGALALLLRYLYGDALPGCARELLKPAAELADLLLLPAVCEVLQDRIAATVTPASVIDDMLWAEQQHHDELLADLERSYLDSAGAVDKGRVVALAVQNPQLMARLHLAMVEHGKPR